MQRGFDAHLRYGSAPMAASKTQARAEPVARSERETVLVRLDRRYRAALMSFFLRRVPDPSEAEDLTQEVFANLAASREGATIGVDGYVFQTAANLLRDRQRREKVRSLHRTHLALDESANVEALEPPRVVAGRQALDEVAEALDELPTRTRAIFLLFRLEHMKQAEIAQLYGISVSAVQKHLLRAMAHLTSRLREHV